MEKNFLFVVALALALGFLSTHWLNVASTAPMTHSKAKAEAPKKPKAS